MSLSDDGQTRTSSHDELARLLDELAAARAEVTRLRAELASVRAADEGDAGAQKRLESLGLLAGGIAHDFNNLLVGILGNAELLIAATPDGGHVSAPLRSILRSAETAADHARELLDYAGRGPGSLGHVNLGAVARDVLELAKPHAEAGQSVALHAHDEPVWVQGDRGQLTRMLLNLVKNALEAMAGRRDVVTLTLAGTESEAVLGVRDTGVGMDEATRARLFDPFFSTKPAGHGFGLSAANAIVQRMGGRIEVESRIGVGSTFRVHLVRSDEPPPREATLATPEPPAHGHILVVDDDATVRETGRALLEDMGFTVEEAADGASAIARAASGRFDAVLLDATMPGLSVGETLSGLRRAAPSLPVLLCSGFARADFARELAAEPQLEFLAKPYRTADLVRMLAKLMG